MYAVLLHIGDYKSALTTISKKLTVDVQLFGLDSAETLQNHLMISQAYQEVGNYLAASAHIQTAIYILRLLGGDQHPEIANIYLRLATIYQSVGNYNLSFTCLRVAKDLVNANGDQGTHALICQSLADVSAQTEDYKEAITHQKECYVITRQLYGEADSRSSTAKAQFEALIRLLGDKTEKQRQEKLEKEKLEKESSDSLWLDDDFGAKSTKKSSKGKKGKKK
jgi:tetratricopeptide (TPR) repeat protein